MAEGSSSSGRIGRDAGRAVRVELVELFEAVAIQIR